MPTTRTGPPLGIDLMRDSIRELGHPGQDRNAFLVFNAARGVTEGALENDVVAAFVGAQPDSVNSTASVFDAAAAQHIALTLVTPQNPVILNGLAISAQAKARITSALSSGYSVVVPTQSVAINGSATTAWYQINPATGEMIGVTEDGGHATLAEWSLLRIAIVAAGVGTAGVLAIAVQAAIDSWKNIFIPEYYNGVPFETARTDAVNHYSQDVAHVAGVDASLVIQLGQFLLGILIATTNAIGKGLAPLGKQISDGRKQA